MSLVIEDNILGPIINAVDSGIMVLDEALEIHFWNQWLQQKTSITPDQAIGHQLDKLAPYIKKKYYKEKYYRH